MPPDVAMRRDRLILLVGLITYGMGQSLLFVIFAPLARNLGLVEWQLGLLVAASNVALAFSAPRWGRASQRIGRRRVFLIGLAGYAVGYAALAFGIQAGLWGWIAVTPLFAVLVGLRLAYGAVVGGVTPAATAYIADTTDETSRGQGMALIAMSGGLGTIIGPVFGGALTFVGPVFPMYAAALLAGLAGAWALVALPEPDRTGQSAAPLALRVLDPRILPYLGGWFVIFGLFTGVQTITAYFIADRMGVASTGEAQRTMMFAMLAMAIVTLLVQAVLLQLWKAAPGVLLRTGFLALAVSMAVLAAGTGVAALYVGYAGFGLSFGLTAPALNAAGSLSVRREEQGAVAGLLAAAPTVGMVFGPLLCGFVYRAWPLAPMAAGVVLALLMVVWLQFVRVPQPAPPARPTQR
jgi:MFS family permease